MLAGLKFGCAPYEPGAELIVNSVSSIALSAVSVASARLARSAQNVANIDTPGYQPESVVAQSAAGGGVTGALRAAAPSFERGADEVLGSGTDLISETAEQLGASQQFKASIALLKTDQDMMKSLLDLKA
jgi:flagellar basal body rod protein FlgC